MESGLESGSKNDYINHISNGNCTKNKLNTSQFQLKSKPSHIIFNLKANGPPSKRMKLSQNEAKSQPVTITSYHNMNENANGTKLNGIKPSKLSLQEQRRQLPIFENRKKLLNLIKAHETLIILGETGCGKTTQIPQYIHSARLEGSGCIAITQPRRVAAISLAQRVAQECGIGMSVGDIVGYSVRFEDVSSSKTKIKYLTDGMLLREAIFDEMLLNYTVVILDEAHERTLHTDILFGIVKTAQKRRREKNLLALKILIMSATMDVDHFSSYFNNCKAVYLEGRTFPVNIYYTVKPHDDYQTACVATFFKIHREAPPNFDVLMFMTGQEEIEAVAHQIRTMSKDPEVEGPPMKIFTLYAALPSSQQLNVFQPVPEGNRKVVISTNIAETSVTITGIRYVIDSGMVKVRSFHPSTGLEMLKVQRISQEQAWQRTGRAGRESEGSCYRIYTSSQFELMSKSAKPEIQRANLNSVVLQLLSLGIQAQHFDFINKPPKEAIEDALEQMKWLGAIDDIEDVKLTETGRLMSKFPLDPRFSKIILMAQKYGCLEEALIIVAFLSGESVLLNPSNRKEEARNVRQKFYSGYGDHVTLLNIYREFSNVGQRKRRVWCHQHFINMRNIINVQEIRAQLEEICKSLSIPSSSCGSQMDIFRKCLLSGLFMNIAELRRDRQYVTIHKKQTVSIHPCSVIHGQLPGLLLFNEVVQTTKCYLRGLSLIESKWLHEVAPDYAKQMQIMTDQLLNRN